MKYVRCFRFIFTFNSFSWIEQKKNKTWNISTWHIIKIPNTFLTLLRTQQFSWHFPDFLAKFLKFLIIPNIPDNVATLWLLIFKFLIKNSYMRHFFFVFLLFLHVHMIALFLISLTLTTFEIIYWKILKICEVWVSEFFLHVFSFKC